MAKLIFLIATTHLVLCPFTKVEESFNIQAMHDILYHKWNLSEYDHLEFPGVVPRTFLGALSVSIVAFPFVFMLQIFELSKFWAQYIVRAVLATSVTLSFHILSRTLEKQFGSRWLQWFIAITVTQSHFMFYMSRPLPNIMCLPLVLLALDGWISNNNKKFILFSGAAIIIFRGELALFFGLLLLYDLLYQRITIKRLFQIAVPGAIAFLSLSVITDSIFWNRPLWPEGEVLWYNIVLNKSSDWGTSPFLWYFYSALPRGLATSLILVPVGCYLDERVRKLVISSMLFVLLYSFLPHKELRFIIYVFPFMNVAAAAACHRIWENRHKTPLFYLLSVGLIGHLVVNIVFTIFLLNISATNYPGGIAIAHLHRLAKNEPLVHVHISNLAAQTGVSRFTQINSSWVYDKTESIQIKDEKFLKYTHLIFEGKHKYSSTVKSLTATHDILDTIEAFHTVSFNYLTMPPIKIVKKPVLFILRRKHNFTDSISVGEIKQVGNVEINGLKPSTDVLLDSKNENLTELQQKEFINKIIDPTVENYPVLNEKANFKEQTVTEKTTIGDENEPTETFNVRNKNSKSNLFAEAEQSSGKLKKYSKYLKLKKSKNLYSSDFDQKLVKENLYNTDTEANKLNSLPEKVYEPGYNLNDPSNSKKLKMLNNIFSESDENIKIEKNTENAISNNELDISGTSMEEISLKNEINKSRVKQNIKKIIQKYKRKKEDKRSNATTTAIDVEPISDDEVTKIEQQIVGIINNSPNILNKEFIKNKLSELIKQELFIDNTPAIRNKPKGLNYNSDEVSAKSILETEPKLSSQRYENTNNLYFKEDVTDKRKLIKKIKKTAEALDVIVNIMDEIVHTDTKDNIKKSNKAYL